jgi:hypothetical protein
MVLPLVEPFRRNGSPGPAPLIEISVTVAGEHWRVAIDGETYDTAQEPWKALVHVRNAVLEAALEDRVDLVSLHAAVVVRGHKALLLAGQPWAGKTTFSFRLLDDGWQYFSDDVAPIDLETGEVLAFPKPPAIRTRPWAELRHLWVPEPEGLPEPKDYFVVPVTNLPVAPYRKARPAGIVHLSYQKGARAQLTQITPALSMLRAAPGARELSAAQFDRLTEICKSVLSVELEYDDIDEGYGVLAKHLAGW